MNQYESYTKIILVFSLQFFRDDHIEYEDHMDILMCIPGIRLSDMSAIDLSEKQPHQPLANFHPKGPLGRLPFLIPFYLLKHVLDLNIKFFFLTLFYINVLFLGK